MAEFLVSDGYLLVPVRSVEFRLPGPRGGRMPTWGQAPQSRLGVQMYMACRFHAPSATLERAMLVTIADKVRRGEIKPERSEIPLFQVLEAKLDEDEAQKALEFAKANAAPPRSRQA